MPLSIAFVLLAGQVQSNIKAYEYGDGFQAGQREMVCGVRPGSGFMNVYMSKETPARFLPHAVVPNGWVEQALGYASWQVKQDTIFGKPCRILKIDGQFNQKLPFSRYHPSDNSLIAKNHIKEQWWVDADNKILRQYVEVSHPDGTLIADSAYGKDTIETRLTDARGKTTFSTVYPTDMEAIQRQFVPMMKDGQVLMDQKKFMVFDPIKRTFLSLTASVEAGFKARVGDDLYAGKTVNISNGTKSMIAYITDENELLQVDLGNDVTMMSNSTPSKKLATGRGG